MKTMKIVFLLLLFNSLQAQYSNYYNGIPRQRNLLWEGNSLSYAASNGAEGGHYVPSSTYNNVKDTYKITYTSYAVSGRTQTLINGAITTNITPYAKKDDVIVLWEGTNDLKLNSLSGADGFANVVTYLNTVQSYGAKVIVCTIIARDYSGPNPDPSDLMDTRIPDYNTLVRNNASTYGYTVCDLAADSHFDQRSDCSNTTYYLSDKIHLTSTGYDLVISIVTPVVQTVLSSLP